MVDVKEYDMILDGQQCGLLRDALVDIFPRRPDLEMMVYIELNVRLADITTADGDYKYTAFQLIQTWAEPKNRAREQIAETLGRIGRPAVPRLIELLTDQDKSLATYAGQAFQQMGPQAADGVPALIAALRDPEINSIWMSQALAHIGKSAIPWGLPPTP